MAENSGGAHCFKYGFTTNYVTGLEVVLPDGELSQLGGKELDRPGYDLLGAFVGSEGTLGVATKIRLRVVPDAARRCARSSRSSTARRAPGEAVSEIVSAGIVPGAIEMMDKLSIEAAEGATHAGYPTDAGAALVVELDGSRGRVRGALRARSRRSASATAPTGVRVAQDEAERELIWRARKAAFARWAGSRPTTTCRTA